MHHQILFVFNPIANMGRAWPVVANLRRVADKLGGADWAGTVYPAHATEIAEKASSQGYKVVVAMGGDGTIHEVINGLMAVPEKERPALGIVPIGSGNDFAYSMNITKNPETALRQVFKGTPRPLDIGCVQDGTNRKEYWMNTLGMGFDAAVNIHSRSVPIFQGFMIYFFAVFRTMIQNYRPYNIQYNIDGKESIKKMLMFNIANGKREGGGFLLAPNARQNDGLLNYTYVDEISHIRMFSAIPYFLKGTHASLDYVKTGTCQKVTINSDLPLWIHTDGEIFAGFTSHITNLAIEVMPNAIQLIS